MKKYSAVVRDGKNLVFIRGQEYQTKSDFIRDLRGNGYKVNPKKVKESDLFEYIINHTNCDWDLKEIPENDDVECEPEEVVNTEITTTRYFYPHGIEGEATETTLKEWDNLDNAIKYARRYANGHCFAGVEVEVNGKIIFEITSDFEEIDHRETEKPQGIFKVVGVNPETGNKQDCVLFARGEEYYVTFEPHLQNATHKSLVWHWHNTDDKIYNLSDEEIELYFNLDAEIAEKIKHLSQIAWDETETMADYHDEIGRIIESVDDENFTLWWYYFTTSNTVHIEEVRKCSKSA